MKPGKVQQKGALEILTVISHTHDEVVLIHQSLAIYHMRGKDIAEFSMGTPSLI